MIVKSYEIQKKLDLSKYNFFLLYGENIGLKKDLKELIKKKINQKDTNTELLNLYEAEIINNEENFFNSIYSGSLFSSEKIIIGPIIIAKIKKLNKNHFKKTLIKYLETKFAFFAMAVIPNCYCAS